MFVGKSRSGIVGKSVDSVQSGVLVRVGTVGRVAVFTTSGSRSRGSRSMAGVGQSMCVAFVALKHDCKANTRHEYGSFVIVVHGT